MKFLSEGFSDARFNRLKDAFSNPFLEPVLLFHNASMQPLTQFNKLLQRNEPTVHVLQPSHESRSSRGEKSKHKLVATSNRRLLSYMWTNDGSFKIYSDTMLP